MEARSIILMIPILLLVIRRFRADFKGGIALCIGLLVSLPDYMRVSFGGGIPEMTIQRVLLIAMLVFWILERNKLEGRLPVPFKGLLLALIAAQFLSFILSITFKNSMKSYFVFVLESVLMFVIVSTTIRSRESVFRVLRAIGAGLGGVAVLSAIERFWGINIPREILLGEGEGRGLVDVMGTYPHRILLGYAMAMGVPVLMSVRECEASAKRKRMLGILILLVVSCCYFANSRGPWLGLIIAAALLTALGSKQMRVSFLLIAALSFVIIVARPGVRETLVDAVGSTFGSDTDSLKHKSYEYRWTLWHVAMSEIEKSPERLLFGYGGLSTESMNLGDYFEKESGGTTALLGYTSWDNQMACDLIEFGLVGLGLELALYSTVLVKLAKCWGRASGGDRSLMAAFLAAIVVYIYATSNVYLFSPQLKCLFWTLVACGVRWGETETMSTDVVEFAAVGVSPRNPAIHKPMFNQHNCFGTL